MAGNRKYDLLRVVGCSLLVLRFTAFLKPLMRYNTLRLPNNGFLGIYKNKKPKPFDLGFSIFNMAPIQYSSSLKKKSSLDG
jgi:hypothetical protein